MARTIVVAVPDELAEMVTDRMWQWGVQAVSETALADGWTEVTTSVGDDRSSIERALSTLDPSWRWEVRAVDDTIAQVAPEFLSPTWYADDMVSVPASLLPFDAGDALVTVIDPGSAFGLGDHPTTRTSMALLAGLLRDRLHDGSVTVATPVRSLLDVGCGTGALAVLAAQLGVSAVRAIDIADAAVEATRRNGELNGVEGSIEVDTTPVSEVVGPFDIVVANILAPVLVSIADDLRRLVRPGGALVISGILADRHDHVLAALAPLAPAASLVHDGWISMVLR
jgi:ribosomal protein L11 methyltransferase